MKLRRAFLGVLTIGFLAGCPFNMERRHVGEDGWDGHDDDEPPIAPGARGPTWSCQPGELSLPDGLCTAAGVSPDACGELFASDDAGGCTAILPAEACEPGMVARLGETACHEVASCGTGTWGDIPVEVNTVYVDPTFPGPSDGTAAAPFATIPEAINAAEAGAIVALAAGSYPEGASLAGKNVRLWGVCPSLVELGALVVDTASAAEIRQIAVTAPLDAVRIKDSADVHIANVWIHDAETGVRVESGSARMSDVLVEGTLTGVDAVPDALTIEDSTIRDGRTTDGGPESVAIRVSHTASTDVPLATVDVQRTVLERHGAALDGRGVLVGLHDVVVRDMSGATGIQIAARQEADVAVYPSYIAAQRLVVVRGGAVAMRLLDSGGTIEAMSLDSDGFPGAGIEMVDMANVANDLVVRSARLEEVQPWGVHNDHGKVVLEGVIVRDVRHVDASEREGMGVFSEGGVLSVRGSRVERASEAGILAIGAAVTVEGTHVVDVAANPKTGAGRGISLEYDLETQVASTGMITGSLVERCRDMGIGIEGGELYVENTAVRDLFLEGKSAATDHAVCYVAEPDPRHDGPATLTLVKSEAFYCQGIGVLVRGSEARIEQSLVEDVRESGDGFGDGIAVLSTTTMPASLYLADTLVAGAARVGLTSRGATVTLELTDFSCNAVDFASEDHGKLASTLVDQGGTQCACGVAEHACTISDDVDVLPATP
jgi:hypothetical protein